MLHLVRVGMTHALSPRNRLVHPLILFRLRLVMDLNRPFPAVSFVTSPRRIWNASFVNCQTRPPVLLQKEGP